jgi:hypothetical protein
MFDRLLRTIAGVFLVGAVNLVVIYVLLMV